MARTIPCFRTSRIASPRNTSCHAVHGSPRAGSGITGRSCSGSASSSQSRIPTSRKTVNRSNPQNPSIRFQSKADLLANRPNIVVPTFGAPPHKSHLDEFGLFIQDDWRVNKKLVLNLGLRYDYYGVMHVYPTSDLPVQIVNLDSPKSFTPERMEFGPLRDPQKPYNPDAVNFG